MKLSLGLWCALAACFSVADAMTTSVPAMTKLLVWRLGKLGAPKVLGMYSYNLHVYAWRDMDIGSDLVCVF